MFRDTPSKYKRHFNKNEGYSTFSLSFAICSIGLGVVGYGVPDVAMLALILGVSAIIIGVLGVRDKRQKKKDSAWLAIILAPIGVFISLDARYMHWISQFIDWL